MLRGSQRGTHGTQSLKLPGDLETQRETKGGTALLVVPSQNKVKSVTMIPAREV